MANRSSGQGPIPIRTANPNPRQATTTSTTTDLPLRSLLTKLTTLISTCYSLCHTIRSNRRLSSSGSATVSLSALEVSLSDALPRLQGLYASLRASHGTAFDIADFTSLNALEASVNVLSNDVKARLSDVADSRAGSKTKSGFKDIRATFTTCMNDAEDAIEALSARLSAASAPPPAPRPVAPAPRSRRESRVRESEAPRVLEKDEIAITYRQFERMDALMRMCWEEEAAEGGRRFRNVADPSRVVYGVVPEGGFVRALQR